MNRQKRLELITQIVSEQEVKTQEELQELLLERGVHVTQATISRDIHSLLLIKVPSKDGGLKYSFKINQEHPLLEMLKHKIMDALVSMEVTQFIIIVKTLPGNAHSFGALFDSMQLEGKVGTLCGNDTCLIICSSLEHAKNIKQQLMSITENKIWRKAENVQANHLI